MASNKDRRVIDIYSAKLHQEKESELKPSKKKKSIKTSETKGGSLKTGAIIYEAEVEKFEAEKELEKPLVETKKRIRKIYLPFKARAIFYIGGPILAAALIFAFWYLLDNVWAKAEIQITTQKQNLEFSENIAMDKSIGQVDVAKKIVPAQLLAFKETKSAEFEPTGPATGGTKAKGKIKIYNNYGPNPQILVATTRFVSPEGKVFRLDNRVVVPAATLKDGNLEPAYVETTVTADQPGEEYNIGPTKFSIPGFQGTPKYEKFYAISEEPMKGGGSNQTKTVTADDLKNAQKVVSDQVFNAFDSDLKAKMTGGLKVLESAKQIKITTIESNAKIGEGVAKFKVTISGEMQALSFDEKQVTDLINELIKDEIPANTKISYFQMEYSNSRLDFQKGQMAVTVKANLGLSPEIDAQSLLAQIKGRNLAEVKTFLSQQKEIKEAKIKLWPSWVGHLPSKADKIKILVD